MKKILSLVLIGMLCITLVGCGTKKEYLSIYKISGSMLDLNFKIIFVV